MDDLAIGRSLRALRRRLGLRQVDLAVRARVSQQLVSRVERGRVGGMTLDTLRRVFAALDADVAPRVRWRGGQLDRLLDERHAAVVGRLAGLLRGRGWHVISEATFSEYGERGSIDLLAWHPSTRTLLVVEVKTEIASAEELLRRHDVKARLAPKVGRVRFGQAPVAVGRLLAIEEGPTNRRRLARLLDVVGAAYPTRGADVRRWVRSPDGPLAGVLFVDPSGRKGSRTAAPTRVRTRRPVSEGAAHHPGHDAGPGPGRSAPRG
jgi:transcriptional regulator with XRE-family HTH domain